MASFRSVTWSVGQKDDKVYIEVWNGEQRLLDANLDPQHANELGHLLIDTAARWGSGLSGQVPTEGACHDPQHDCVDDCPQCGPGALRERVASAAVAVMVGSPHIVKGKVSQIAWDVAHEVVNRIDLSGQIPVEEPR